MVNVLAFRIGLVALGGGGPLREREAMNLGIVADVDRKLRVEVEKFNGCGVRMLKRENPQFTSEEAGGRRIFDHGFDDQRGTLAATFAETDEGAAGDPGVASKHLLARLGVECALLRFDSLNFASNEPQTTVGIEVAAVAHAMPNGAGAAERSVESRGRGG